MTFTLREFKSKPLDGSGWIDKRLVTIKLLVDFPFVDDDLGYNILMGFGHKCECLSPEDVRIELINRIQKLLKIYKEYLKNYL